jgi:nicotinamide-nucleotide amidase
MLPEETLAQAARVLDLLRARGWKLATAESCTGGLIAAALTHVAGSSDVVKRGFVTYANEAKTGMLGVPPALLARVGAVSQDIAALMAEGALARAGVEIAVSVTGIAGPGGGSAEKPVGLVWFGLARRGEPVLTQRCFFSGDRAAIRAAAVANALTLLETV